MVTENRAPPVCRFLLPLVLLVGWCIASPPRVESDSPKKPTVGETASPPPQKGGSPAVASSDVNDAIKRAKDKAAANVDAVIIKAISVEREPPPAPGPSPGPSPDPPPNPAPPPPNADFAQPVLVLPELVTALVGMPTKVKAQTNGVMVRWVAKDDGLAMIDGELLKDSTITQVWANAPGQYRLLAYTSLNDILSDPVQCVVMVHGAQPPPQPVPPQPVPPQPVPPQPIPPEPIPPEPVPPPVTQAARLWVVTIDNVAKRNAATNVLLDMQLQNAVQAAGHQFRKLNSTMPEAQKFKPMIDANGGIPVVVLMDADKVEHNWLNQAPLDLKLPTTSQAFKNLVNKYTTSKVQ